MSQQSRPSLSGPSANTRSRSRDCPTYREEQKRASDIRIDISSRSSSRVPSAERVLAQEIQVLKASQIKTNTQLSQVTEQDKLLTELVGRLTQVENNQSQLSQQLQSAITAVERVQVEAGNAKDQTSQALADAQNAKLEAGRAHSEAQNALQNTEEARTEALQAQVAARNATQVAEDAHRIATEALDVALTTKIFVDDLRTNTQYYEEVLISTLEEHLQPIAAQIEEKRKAAQLALQREAEEAKAAARAAQLASEESARLAAVAAAVAAESRRRSPSPLKDYSSSWADRQYGRGTTRL